MKNILISYHYIYLDLYFWFWLIHASHEKLCLIWWSNYNSIKYIRWLQHDAVKSSPRWVPASFSCQSTRVIYWLWHVGIFSTLPLQGYMGQAVQFSLAFSTKHNENLVLKYNEACPLTVSLWWKEQEVPPVCHSSLILGTFPPRGHTRGKSQLHKHSVWCYQCTNICITVSKLGMPSFQYLLIHWSTSVAIKIITLTGLR